MLTKCIPHIGGARSKFLGGPISGEDEALQAPSSSAEGGGMWEGVSPSPPGEGAVSPLHPLPREIFDFDSQYDEFWCILSGIFYSLATYFTRKMV